MTTKAKFKELKELRKIPKNKLTDEQKERIKQLLKELAKIILRWLLDVLTLGTSKLIKNKIMKTKTENKKLFKVHEVENTPFNVLEQNEQYQIVIGNEIISKTYKTLEETLKIIKQKPWWLIVATTHMISKKN